MDKSSNICCNLSVIIYFRSLQRYFVISPFWDLHFGLYLLHTSSSTVSLSIYDFFRKVTSRSRMTTHVESSFPPIQNFDPNKMTNQTTAGTKCLSLFVIPFFFFFFFPVKSAVRRSYPAALQFCSTAIHSVVLSWVAQTSSDTLLL